MKKPTRKGTLEFEKENEEILELKEKGYKVIRLWENNINKMEVSQFQNIINQCKGVGAC
jgi:very-short-patch-repair endonuclease